MFLGFPFVTCGDCGGGSTRTSSLLVPELLAFPAEYCRVLTLKFEQVSPRALSSKRGWVQTCEPSQVGIKI